MDLYTVVHPIGPDDYPGQPQGWRWAIHTDDQLHQVVAGCLNAGWEATQAEAERTLSFVLVTVRRALNAAGVGSSVVAHTLCDCPLTGDIVAELARVG